MTGEERRERSLGWLLYGLIGLTVVSFLAVLVTTIVLWAQPDDFQPLEYDTVKVVVIDDDGVPTIPQVEGFEAPSVLLSEFSVPFVADQCNTHDEEIEAHGLTWFVSEDTGDRFQFSQSGTNFVIPPGCRQLRFPLGMPRGMINEVDDQGDERGTDHALFFVEGELHIDGGDTAYWVSESFIVIDDDPVIPAD